MTLRKSLSLLITLSAIGAFVGCGGSSSSAPPAPVAISLATVSTPLTVNSITPVTATVTGDPANAGVTWSCTPTPGCGTFSATTSASLVPVDYIAPPIAPSGTIVITAASVTSPTTTAASQAITIASASLADGNYVFHIQGFDQQFSPYFVAGAFTVASGAVTTGEQDFGDEAFGPLQDAITSGTVTTTTDGNIQITLVTGDLSIGVLGTETINAAVVPFPAGASYALINEYDASASGSGELDLQTSTAAPAGGYAFEIGGLDNNGEFLAMGGILDVNSAGGTISRQNSVFDANDSDNAGLFSNQLFNDSTVVATDPLALSFGRVQFTLNPVDSGDFPTIALVGYPIDGSRIALVETVDSYFGITGGMAYSQSSSLVGKFAATNFSGNTYVTGMTGLDISGFLQVATQLTPASAGDGSVAGFVDFNDLGATLEPASPDPVTAAAGAAVVDATGRVTLTGLADGVGTIYPTNVQLYLDGNGHALSISMDPGDILNGVGYQQAASAVGAFNASALANGYAMGVTGWDINYDGEFDAVSSTAADGVGTTTGLADINWLVFGAPVTYTDEPVTGTFTSSSNGIFTGTITGLDLTDCQFANVLNAGCSADTFNYYLFDLFGDGFVIETDFGTAPSQLTMGRIASQQ